MKPLVFSVEDDVNIQNVIQIALTNSNYIIKTFSNFNSLDLALREETPDLILLDIMLPDIDGIQIIRHLKKEPKYINIPIMIISAKISEIDRVIGLDSGADDYLIKPFGVLELVSRVKALLRRTKGKATSEIIKIQDIEMNRNRLTCKFKDNPIILTKKQFDLLWYISENAGEIATRDELMNSIWGFDYIGESRTVDVHIKEIRKKLKSAGVTGQVIETIRGVGYRFIL